ncbi:hypothetical protein EDD15DRAFT_1443840 [Pisolithus albus]|nr:hypothetical protein EDD15DRAFT_1443840 [Pisolithus albus]
MSSTYYPTAGSLQPIILLFPRIVHFQLVFGPPWQGDKVTTKRIMTRLASRKTTNDTGIRGMERQRNLADPELCPTLEVDDSQFSIFGHGAPCKVLFSKVEDDLPAFIQHRDFTSANGILHPHLTSKAITIVTQIIFITVVIYGWHPSNMLGRIT